MFAVLILLLNKTIQDLIKERQSVAEKSENVEILAREKKATDGHIFTEW